VFLRETEGMIEYGDGKQALCRFGYGEFVEAHFAL
jgi:hypothetical protein